MKRLQGVKNSLLAALLTGCGAVAAQSAAPRPLPAAPTEAPARAGMERQDIRAQLLPRRYTTVAAEIGAKINRLPVAEGGAFKSPGRVHQENTMPQQPHARLLIN